MNIAQVKLIVTDMDGTLLNSNHEVSTRFYSQFKVLKQKGIHFAVASGRQFQSIIEKLEPIKNDISIIAENGGILSHNQSETALKTIPSDQLVNALQILRTIPDINIVLCGKDSAYIETKNEYLISKFAPFYSTYKIVDDLTKVANDIFLKIAVYHDVSSQDYILPYCNSIGKQIQVIVSGQHWLDISHPDINKGYALKMLQKTLGVSINETMIFGDYNNDLQMLPLGYFSYAMENAPLEVKNVARFVTKSNNDEGVETVIDDLLKHLA